MEYETVAEAIREGGVGVIPTDTLYALVASALDAAAVERVYDLKHRDSRKPLIVLIADMEDVEQFGVILSEELMAQLSAYWPGPVTIILPTHDEQFEYLTRATDAIAFRLPDNDELRELIRESGPIVAPGANVEGLPPAENVREARGYFGTDVDFYIEGEDLYGKPSTILRYDDGEFTVVRE